MHINSQPPFIYWASVSKPYTSVFNVKFVSTVHMFVHWYVCFMLHYTTLGLELKWPVCRTSHPDRSRWHCAGTVFTKVWLQR